MIFSFTYISNAGGNFYKISGRIRGLTGEHKVHVNIYSSARDFKSGFASKSLIIYPDKIREGRGEYYFFMSEGEYLINAFEDINDDGKLNCGGFFNAPAEPYGFYRKFRPFLNSVSFEKLKFNLNKEIKNANITLIKI